MALANLTTADLYTDSVDPTATINPKKRGSLYINNVTGEAWTCTDNTLNRNVWAPLFKDQYKNLGNVTGTFNFSFAGANNKFQHFTMVLTGDTYFGTVTAAGATPRSGSFTILSGGARLKRFFTNPYNSITLPFTPAPNNSGNNNFLAFFYMVYPTGHVVFTRA